MAWLNTVRSFIFSLVHFHHSDNQNTILWLHPSIYLTRLSSIILTCKLFSSCNLFSMAIGNNLFVISS